MRQELFCLRSNSNLFCLLWSHKNGATFDPDLFRRKNAYISGITPSVHSGFVHHRCGLWGLLLIRIFFLLLVFSELSLFGSSLNFHLGVIWISPSEDIPSPEQVSHLSMVVCRAVSFVLRRLDLGLRTFDHFTFRWCLLLHLSELESLDLLEVCPLLQHSRKMYFSFISAFKR